MASSGVRFARIYDSLPEDVKITLVEEQLIPLMDHIDEGKVKEMVASASKLQQRHAEMPKLDLKAKEREVDGLFNELGRDAKRSLICEGSHHSDLLEQTVNSVTSWLNDIWRVVYEHNVDFTLAHQCLLFTVVTLDKIEVCRGTSFPHFVHIILQRKSGEVVKSWQLNGTDYIGGALHFIWRDLFLSMFATSNQRQINKIPEMLDDIASSLGWTSLEEILYGGQKCLDDMDSHEDDEVETEVDKDAKYTVDGSDMDAINQHDKLPKLPDRDQTPTPFHAKHWSPSITAQMIHLRTRIHAAMMSIFKISPSLALYSATLANALDPEKTSAELLLSLTQFATTGPEVFLAALEIHTLNNNTVALASLLSTHSHLLRPRDAPIYQSAVTTLTEDPLYLDRAREIIEKEILDVIAAVRSALAGPFSKLDTAENKVEIEQILKSRLSVVGGLQGRIQRWVDAISISSIENSDVAAFKVVITAMGFFMPDPPSIGDVDPLNYFDLNSDDPDTEDLRDRFRPQLKQRFEGWMTTTNGVRGGGKILVKVYKELMKTMPYLRMSDVVEEMLGRLADKPSKQYLIGAVDALSAFVKVQRRKIARMRVQKRVESTAVQTSVPASSSILRMPCGSAPPRSSSIAGLPSAYTWPEERLETYYPPLEFVNTSPAPLLTSYPARSPPPMPGLEAAGAAVFVVEGGGGGVGGFGAEFSGRLDDVD